MGSLGVYAIDTARIHKIAFILLAAFTLAFLAAMSSSAITEAGDTPHDPILITDNADFNATNGVVSGAGTLANPFVISGWRIDASSSTGIEIRDTDKHFTITNVTIVGENDTEGYSIYLYRVSNGKLDGILDQRNNGTTELVSSDGVTVTDYVQTRGTITGFRLVRCDNSILTRIKLVSALLLSRSQDSTIQNCIAPFYRMSSMHRSTLKNCTDAGSQGNYGILVTTSNSAEIIDCTFSNNTVADVWIESGENVLMRDCDMGARGVKLDTEGFHRLGQGNTVNGSALRYYLNQTDVIFANDAGQVILVGCADVLCWNLTMRSAYIPVILRGSENVTMDGLDLAGYQYCLDIQDCRNVTIINATVQVDDATTGSTVRPTELRNAPGLRLVNCQFKVGFNFDVHYIVDPDQASRELGLSMVNCTMAAVYHGVYFWGESMWDLSIDQCTFSRTREGIYAREFGRVTVTNSLFQNCSYSGIYLWNEDYTISDVNEISNCTFYDNWLALQVAFTDNVLIADNLVVNSTNRAINVYESEYAVVRNNIIEKVQVGSASYTPEGIGLRGQFFTVERNTVTDCDVGIAIDHLTDSLVRLNNVSGCDWGLQVQSDCQDNQIIHNIFEFNNYNSYSGRYRDKQATSWISYVLIINGTEGNYWGDYTRWYPNAQPLNERVWDTPYDFYRGPCEDPYPLIIRPDWFPPIAMAGSDMTVPQGTNVSLDGSASTDDIGIVRYEWDLVQGEWQQNATGAWFNITLDDAGTVMATLRVWDLWGNVGRDTIIITVTDIYPPVADAGPDISVAIGEQIDLDGSASHDNMDVVGYEWTVDPGGLDLVLHGSSVSFTIDVPGMYQVVLRVIDAAGLEGRDELNVTVSDVVPPVADAGQDVEVDQGATVHLDGSRSTDDVGIILWSWYFLYDGSMVRIDSMTTSFVFDLAGEYLVTMEVRDKAGHTHSDTMTVRVNDTEPPVAVLDQDRVVHEGIEVTLDGLGSTDNVGIVGYVWTFVHNGLNIQLEGGYQTFRFLEVGEHVVTLEVTDAAGNSAEGTFKVVVVDVTDPTSEAEVLTEVDQGTLVILDGSLSHDNIGVTEGSWEFTVGGEPVLLQEIVTQFTFELAGEYELVLTVYDAVGNTGEATFVLRVRDIEPPFCRVSMDRTVISGTRVSMDAGNTTDNVGVETYEWSITVGGKTEHLTGRAVEHLFDTAGKYTVDLVATDAAGNSGSVSVNVTVLPSEVEWRLGLFLDGKGRPVEGMSVTVVVGGTTYNGTTDAWGWVDLEMRWVDLVGPVEVTVSKKGWKDSTFTMGLDDDRNPTGDIPVMTKEEKEESSPSIGAFVALTTMVALAVLVRRRREA